MEHLGNGISKDPEHEIFQEIPVSQEQMKLIEFDEFSPAKSAKQPLKSLNQEQTFYHVGFFIIFNFLLIFWFQKSKSPIGINGEDHFSN